MVPGTLPKSENYYRTTPKSTSISDYLKISKTAPAATNAAKQSSLIAPKMEANVMKSHDEPIPIKKKGKFRIIEPGVTKPMHIHERMDAIMDVTV